MRKILILLFLSCDGLLAQSINHEQIAFDYFMDSIFVKNFTDVKRIKFSGQTEESLTSFGFLDICFKGEEALRTQIAKNAADSTRPALKINTKQVDNNPVFKKKNARSKFALFILQANEVNGKNYVLIEIIKRRSNTFMYFFEIDERGQVLRWCETGMIH